MANEAKTYSLFRDMLRSKGYYDDEQIVVEEQKSDNPKIDKLLKNASKKGNKNGYPDFILYSKIFPELLVVVEAKADINKHESETRDNYADIYSFSYVSTFEFVPNSNVSVLIPLRKMSIQEKLYYAQCITNNRYKFSYGRKPKGDRLKSVLLPEYPPKYVTEYNIDKLVCGFSDVLGKV